MHKKHTFLLSKKMVCMLLLTFFALQMSLSFAESAFMTQDFPRADISYLDSDISGYLNILKHRISVEPFNFIATVIFFLAIAHTMLTSLFLKLASQIAVSYTHLTLPTKRIV